MKSRLYASSFSLNDGTCPCNLLCYSLISLSCSWVFWSYCASYNLKVCFWDSIMCWSSLFSLLAFSKSLSRTLTLLRYLALAEAISAYMAALCCSIRILDSISTIESGIIPEDGFCPPALRGIFGTKWEFNPRMSGDYLTELYPPLLEGAPLELMSSSACPQSSDVSLTENPASLI